MKVAIIALMFTLIILQAGCEQTNKKTTAQKEAQPVVSVSPSLPKKKIVTGERFNVYIEQSNYKLSMYEPKEGCYLGAFILNDKRIDGDIKQFETLTEKSHAFYTYNYTLGDQFPLNWVLTCISQTKTPFVVVQPQLPVPNSEEALNLTIDKQLLEQTAKAFGNFNIPMFIKFCPVDTSYKPSEYIAFYKAARTAFRKYAPKCAFVWSVSSEDAFNCTDYYPSDSSVDWVAIDICQNIVEQNKYNDDVFKAIEYFYFTFQKQKPIMLSKLAISNFSSVDYSYCTPLASSEIERIYTKIANDYPRIKAINYFDVNEINVSQKNKITQNYSITENEAITLAYIKATSNEKFLNSIESKSEGENNSEWILSPFAAYKIDKEVYVSESTIIYDLDVLDWGFGMNERMNEKVINNNKYYTTDFIDKSKYFKLSVEPIKRKIFINV